MASARARLERGRVIAPRQTHGEAGPGKAVHRGAAADSATSRALVLEQLAQRLYSARLSAGRPPTVGGFDQRLGRARHDSMTSGSACLRQELAPSICLAPLEDGENSRPRFALCSGSCPGQSARKRSTESTRGGPTGSDCGRSRRRSALAPMQEPLRRRCRSSARPGRGGTRGRHRRVATPRKAADHAAAGPDLAWILGPPVGRTAMNSPPAARTPEQEAPRISSRAACARHQGGTAPRDAASRSTNRRVGQLSLCPSSRRRRRARRDRRATSTRQVVAGPIRGTRRRRPPPP